MNQFKLRLLSYWLMGVLLLSVSCNKENTGTTGEQEDNPEELVIFHFNDAHGRLNNFAKIKKIVDNQSEKTPVILVSAGDIFSGNPVVDNYPDKGYPMIDMMNFVGVDLSVLGNHEFDYGETILSQRLEQSEFPWICANITTEGSEIPQPEPWATISREGIDVTFVSFVETGGKEDDVIPSTHPWRVKNFVFKPYEEVVSEYTHIREETQSDVVVALTHLGKYRDFELAETDPFMDVIIGGHSHSILRDEIVNGVPVCQAGDNLNYLGKITVKFNEAGAIDTVESFLIDLNAYAQEDAKALDKINAYEEEVNLDEQLGESGAYHPKSDVGCFYTDAIMRQLQVDITLQNSGGVRAPLDQGPITKREILTIDPFNNGSVIYSLTVGEIEDFLESSGAGMFYAGVKITQEGQDVELRNLSGDLLPDAQEMKLGINDYIAAVHDGFFDNYEPNIQDYTTAELMMQFLRGTDSPIDYTGCTHYFRYSK